MFHRLSKFFHTETGSNSAHSEKYIMDRVGSGNSLTFTGPSTPARSTPKSTIVRITSPSTTASSPRKISGLKCSLDLDSSDDDLDDNDNGGGRIGQVEHIKSEHQNDPPPPSHQQQQQLQQQHDLDGDDADTMERSTTSSVVGEEGTLPVSDVVHSGGLFITQQPQSAKRNLFEVQDQRPRRSIPMPSSHSAAMGTSSDPVCLDDDDDDEDNDNDGDQDDPKDEDYDDGAMANDDDDDCAPEPPNRMPETSTGALETPNDMLETPTTRDSILEVGYPVYAPLPGNHGWRLEPCWGLITAKFMGPDGRFLYCIDLNEGDKIGLPGLSAEYIHPLESRIRLEIKGEAPRTFPHQKYLDLWNVARYGPSPVRWCKARTSLVLSNRANYTEHRGRFASPSMLGSSKIVGPDKSSPTLIVGPGLCYEKLYQFKCGTCYQCITRPICGSCVSCNYNNMSRGLRPKQICVQKMCLNIPIQEKCQHCPMILPPDWYFGFDQEFSNNSHRGLWIVTPSKQKKFKIFERAKKLHAAAFRGLEAANFYRYVGLGDVLTKGPGKGSPLSQREKEPPPSTKLQPQQTRLATPITTDANQSSITAAPTIATPPIPRGQETCMDLQETYRNTERCNRCINCRRPPCRLCHTCRTSMPLGCLRRMCNRVYQAKKITLLEHLPRGWSFFFDSVVDLSEMGRALDGLKIVAPNGSQFPSLESARKAHPQDFPTSYQYSSHAFYNFVGINVAGAMGGTQVNNVQPHKIDTSPARKRPRHDDNKLVPSVIEIDCSTSDDERSPATTIRRPLAPHVLCDQPFYREWLRVDGTKTFITGKITRVVNESGGNDKAFTAELYVDHQAKVDEAAGRLQDYSSSVMTISHHDAWDGCLRSYHKSGQNPRQLILNHVPRCYERWETPEIYQRTMVSAQGVPVPGFHLLPCIEMTYKGFILQFSVKASSTQTTRFGVFLSIKPLFNSSASILHNRLVLPAGTLLDMGVVAPLRNQDIRDSREHLIKSAIHSSQDPKYQFLNRHKQGYFDISDDRSNDLHLIARRHLPAFVQQIAHGNSIRASVCARFDPEGALHYLLGHPEMEQGDCVFLANGLEQEIYVDVHEHHAEPPAKHADGRSRLTMSENIESRFMKEVQSFAVKDINQFVKSYKPLIAQDPPPTKCVLVRIIAVAIVMRQRLERLQEQSVDVALDSLAIECEHIIQEGIQAWELCYTAMDADFQQAAAESSLFQLVFSKVYRHGSIDSLSPAAFRGAICPRHATFSMRD